MVYMGVECKTRTYISYSRLSVIVLKPHAISGMSRCDTRAHHHIVQVMLTCIGQASSRSLCTCAQLAGHSPCPHHSPLICQSVSRLDSRVGAVRARMLFSGPARSQVGLLNLYKAQPGECTITLLFP